MNRLPSIRAISLTRIAAFAVLVLAALAVLSVNTFPAVGNDSLVYIEHSKDIGDFGFVREGFRNVGYPVFLAIARLVSGVFGLEPLLMAAVAQRVLLLTVAFLAWRSWRWFALPLIVLMVAPDVIAFSNLILVEGISMGLAGLAAVAAYRCLRSAPAQQAGVDSNVMVWFWVLCGSTYALFAMKFIFVGFTLVPLIVVAALWKHRARSQLMTTVAVYAVAVLGLTLIMSMENSREIGVLRPSFDEYAAEYYYAWVHVFRQGENEFRPELARFYNDGELRPFLRATDSGSVPDLETRLELRRTEIEAMLETTGMGVHRSQVEATLWALVGGRLHDTGRVVGAVANATGEHVQPAIHVNDVSIDVGHQAFADEYNDGRMPGSIITDPAGWSILPRGRLLVALLLPVSIIVALFGLWVRETRWMAVAAIVPVSAQAVGLGLVRADNFRFLLTPAIYTIAMATAVVSCFVWVRSRHRQPTVPPAAM